MPISYAKCNQVKNYLEGQGCEFDVEVTGGLLTVTGVQPSHIWIRGIRGTGTENGQHDIEGDGRQAAVSLFVDDNLGGKEVDGFVRPFVNYSEGQAAGLLVAVEKYIWPEGTEDVRLEVTASAKKIGDIVIMWSNDVVAWLNSGGVQKSLERRGS